MYVVDLGSPTPMRLDDSIALGAEVFEGSLLRLGKLELRAIQLTDSSSRSSARPIEVEGDGPIGQLDIGDIGSNSIGNIESDSDRKKLVEAIASELDGIQKSILTKLDNFESRLQLLQTEVVKQSSQLQEVARQFADLQDKSRVHDAKIGSLNDFFFEPATNTDFSKDSKDSRDSKDSKDSKNNNSSDRLALNVSDASNGRSRPGVSDTAPQKNFVVPQKNIPPEGQPAGQSAVAAQAMPSATISGTPAVLTRSSGANLIIHGSPEEGLVLGRLVALRTEDETQSRKRLLLMLGSVAVGLAIALPTIWYNIPAGWRNRIWQDLTGQKAQ